MQKYARKKNFWNEFRFSLFSHLTDKTFIFVTIFESFSTFFVRWMGEKLGNRHRICHVHFSSISITFTTWLCYWSIIVVFLPSLLVTFHSVFNCFCSIGVQYCLFSILMHGCVCVGIKISYEFCTFQSLNCFTMHFSPLDFNWVLRIFYSCIHFTSFWLICVFHVEYTCLKSTSIKR